MAPVGKIEAFDINVDNWELYIERLEQYFIVNKIEDGHKVATLITVMGGASYELLVTLCTPDKPATKAFKDLVAIMNSQLRPKPSILAERYIYRQRKQRKEETVAEYVAELKKLSKGCEFGNWLEESLRDQLVCGLSSEVVRQRLFTEENLTFEKALVLAIAIEAAEKNAAIVDGSRETGAYTEEAQCYTVSTERARRGMTSRGRQGASNRPVMRGAGRRDAAQAVTGRDGVAPTQIGGKQNRCSLERVAQCNVCGGQHASTKCKFINYVCKVCYRPGHLKKMCPRLRCSSEASVYNNCVQEFTDTDLVDGNNEQIW